MIPLLYQLSYTAARSLPTRARESSGGLPTGQGAERSHACGGGHKKRENYRRIEADTSFPPLEDGPGRLLPVEAVGVSPLPRRDVGSFGASTTKGDPTRERWYAPAPRGAGVCLLAPTIAQRVSPTAGRARRISTAAGRREVLQLSLLDPSGSLIVDVADVDGLRIEVQ